jgi:alpha-glucosidase (family GH31 glycosyl hydrolase)
VWHAALAAPPHGSTLAYTLESDGVRGETYVLRGEAWVTGGGCAYLDSGVYAVRPDPHAHPVPAADDGPLLPLVEVAWLTDSPNEAAQARRVRITFAARADERFFGTGERFNALNQRGEVLDVRVYEQYKTQGTRTYMPIPFLLSSAGYGIWVESTRWMQFDLCATAPDTWTLEADVTPNEPLRLHVFTDDDPPAIIRQFTLATGTPQLPPLWAFGLWMSGNEWNTQDKVEREVAASFAHAIPPSVLVIEAWSDETTFYIWNDAQYTPISGAAFPRYADFTFPAHGKWRDPKAMVEALHAQGVHVLLWQIPVMKLADAPHPQHDADRAHVLAHHFAVREPDGSPHAVRPFWFRGGWLWDVTHPDARAWWLNKRRYLLDEVGIDGFKTDGGEHLWSTQVVFADGRTGAEVWNAYPQLYTQAYYDFANAVAAGQQRQALTFSRAGFTGSHASPAHWAGDENSTWEAFRASIIAGLSAAISGISFWGWDLGGFSGEIPSAELYLRGAAMAAFCPIFQYHSEYNAHREPLRDRTPWNMQARTGDTRVLPTFRFFTQVRHNLMPYIWHEAQHSAVSGEPMLRALALTEPLASPYTYWFGRELLVFPVTDAGATETTVHLPAGDWRDLWTGTAHAAGAHRLAAPLDRIPVFVRAGTRLPVRLAASRRLGEAVPLSGEANDVLAFD